MKLIEPGRPPGQSIERFGSVGAERLGGIRFEGEGALAFLRLDPGGHIGRHPTVLTQVFVVVQGEGWISGSDGRRVEVSAGQAAVWEPGEQHESGTATGMTVVVLEAATVRT